MKWPDISPNEPISHILASAGVCFLAIFFEGHVYSLLLSVMPLALDIIAFCLRLVYILLIHGARGLGLAGEIRLITSRLDTDTMVSISMFV